VVTTPVESWADFPGPRHADELQVAHEGSPPVEVQNLTHGAGAPAEDHGMDDRTKYGAGGS
jgi:hypothetical protein